MDELAARRIRVLGWLFFMFCIAACLWVLVSTIITVQTTGILYVSSPDSKASLVISQNNRQAVAVGVAQAKVRLQPGSYQLSGLDGDKQANGTVTIYKKRTTRSSLNPVHSVRLPSIGATNYIGIDDLLNYGIPSSQLDNLKQALFEYSKSTETVSVDANSISPTPHDPNSTSTLGSVKFRVVLDSKAYAAVMDYDNLGGGFRLYLYNPQNSSLVFDSGASSTPGGG